MNHRAVLLYTTLLTLSLTACQQQAPSSSPVEASTPMEASAPQPQVPTPVTNPSIVESNRLVMYASDPRVQNWEGIGTRDGGRLISNATNGYLMFGPKLPFDAGKYRVSIYGDSLEIATENSLVFDVTSNEGKQVHAKLGLDDKVGFTPTEPMASFEFELPAPVDDLEVRAYVTSGTAVTLTRYEVTPVSDTTN